MDQIYPPFESRPAAAIFDIVEKMPVNSRVRIRVTGEDIEGRLIDKTIMLPLGAAGSGEGRLSAAGIALVEVDGKMIIDNVVFGSVAQKQKLDFDFEIVSVEVQAQQAAKQWFYVPALLVLGLIIMLQRRRRGATDSPRRISREYET